ncbi:hypothetical protein [Nocardia farcinica]|nr:hypothetical protein [Nocardia farcinica]
MLGRQEAPTMAEKSSSRQLGERAAAPSAAIESAGVQQSWVATEACTLPTPQQPLREAEFDALFRDALRRVHRASPTVLWLDLDARAGARARDLAHRESACCSFFSFAFTAVGTASIRMNVEVPAERVDVLDGLAARARAVSRE